MLLYRTVQGPLVEHAGTYHRVDEEWDALINAHDLLATLRAAIRGPAVPPAAAWLAPIGAQEGWAAGVTYWRSRDARMTESKEGGSFYDRVYEAERPELFFKATPHRVVAPGGRLRLRRDAR